jgi:hypothetical protein
MPFSQSLITQVRVQPDGPDLLITWDSTAPAGTIVQVYVDRRLSWFGTSRRCHVPVPAGSSGRNVWVDVGTVGGGEAHTDFSEDLASLTRGAGAVELEWLGGTYLDPTGQDDVQGFHVYRSPTPNARVDLSAPVDDVPAYPGGWVSDGFGLGGFGQGGFGRSANSYVWSAEGLASGAWQFSVVPYDRSKTESGTGQTVSVSVTAAPLPPAQAANGQRLSYTYSGPATRQVTLSWLASPSA